MSGGKKQQKDRRDSVKNWRFQVLPPGTFANAAYYISQRVRHLLPWRAFVCFTCLPARRVPGRTKPAALTPQGAAPDVVRAITDSIMTDSWRVAGHEANEPILHLLLFANRTKS